MYLQLFWPEFGSPLFGQRRMPAASARSPLSLNQVPPLTACTPVLRCTHLLLPVVPVGVVLWEIITGDVPLRGLLRQVQCPKECPQVRQGRAGTGLSLPRAGRSFACTRLFLTTRTLAAAAPLPPPQHKNTHPLTHPP